MYYVAIIAVIYYVLILYFSGQNNETIELLTMSSFKKRIIWFIGIYALSIVTMGLIMWLLRVIVMAIQ